VDKKYLKWVGILILVIIFAYVVRSSFLNTIVTFDKFPLVEKWYIKLNENIQQISISDNKIVLVRTASGINALDIKSGQILWHHDTGWRAGNETVLAKNGIVFFTDNKWVWALNQYDGAVLWQQRLHSESAKVVDVSKDVIAVFDWQQLFIFKATDGTLLLRKAVCRNSNLAYIKDARLYFPCFGMTTVDISSGKTIWETKDDRADTAIAYVDDVMYSSPSEGIFTAYDLENRIQIWRKNLPSDRVHELVVSGEFLFITDGKQLCVLKRRDGSTKWCDRGTMNPQNPVKIGDIVFIFNGPQNEVTAFDISSGVHLGQLRITNFNLFTVFRQLMVSSDELLIFGSGKEIFAFGK
jgi:hypothetical protein